ncbi:VOC family protein [Chitinilyticum litopenaei]|uniref:VOC family protein n=1 Tax=Chitinilyticum litopenaei TaxID=1121276 RepID=UPI0004219F58|nr:VOC family protein [Chitinilyticum litopenaei]
MQSRISLITLGVADLPRARAFYQALGFRERPESQESVAFLQLDSGALLSLYGRAALAEDAGLPDDGGGFPRFSLAHNVASPAEVDALLSEAVAAGATLVKAGQQVFWGGYSGYFADPDGFLWEVAHNPFLDLTGVSA